MLFVIEFNVVVVLMVVIAVTFFFFMFPAYPFPRLRTVEAGCR